MAELTIKDLDEGTLRSIEHRAKATGASIEQSARDLLNLGLLYARQAATPRDDPAGSYREPDWDDAGVDPAALARRVQDGVQTNEVPPEEALRIVREMRAQLGGAVFPDSTPGIRHDRDTR